MIKINQKEQCCGCGACAQICPKSCIAMLADSEGFLYPTVEENNCIHCSKCETVCPVRNAKPAGETVRASYLAYTKEESVRLKSSSGGIFRPLAEWVLNAHGVVFGAAFDQAFMVHHRMVDQEDDLAFLQGSKYLQSRTENTYNEVKAVLERGNKVLYSGTACQIEGLKDFLGRNYDNLYTVDVFCHGVPSPKVWKLYLDWQEKCHGCAVTRTFFRQKNFGWKMFALEFQFRNSNAYIRVFHEDPYMQMFLRNICLRPSCHACKFKNLERGSDLSIGDAWGVEKKMPEMDDDKGTSIVLVHTEKGQKLIDSIAETLVLREAEVDTVLPKNADSRTSVMPHKNRKKFFAKLKKTSDFASLMPLLEPSVSDRVKRRIKKLFGF